MRSARGFLLGFLVLLFLGLSFNAYACLVPLYGAADARGRRGDGHCPRRAVEVDYPLDD